MSKAEESTVKCSVVSSLQDTKSSQEDVPWAEVEKP